MGYFYKYSDEVKRFIADNVVGTTTRDLVKLVNEKFGTKFTISKMRAFKKNHNLKSNTKVGIESGKPTKLYPPKIFYFIMENYKGTGPKEMTTIINEKFNTEYTHNQIKIFYKNRKLNSGLDGRFKPGQIPHNKGKKGISTGGFETQFKKGNLPHNHLPVGSERVNGEGYVDIKIADPNVWKPKHHIIWEKANGDIPEGHCILFGDGNRGNINLENLLLVSRSELARLNQFGLIKNDAELTKVGLNVVKLRAKVTELEKE